MIVYEATRGEFTEDVFSNAIEGRILAAFQQRLGHSTSRAEIEAWRNSMGYMNNALLGAGIPADAGVAIEYRIPQTAKRVDFILTGLDPAGRHAAVIVELKQWSEAAATAKDGIVETFVGGSRREVEHPSYQAWSYAWYMRDYNEAAHDDRILLRPCAYLHNLENADALNSPFYEAYTSEAPLFARSDSERLQDFLRRYIHKGDRKRVLYQIENGRIRPSKNLADHLASLLKGNREFILLDEQKLVYETALEKAALAAKSGRKQVLIVEGGPGTGKSVAAIHLLVALTKRGLVTQYVTRNAAPRGVYEQKLTGAMRRTRIRSLFKSSGAYVDADPSSLDVLIVDEAHRLNEKSGLYGNLGDHQVAEIIRASQCCVFFVDDDQRVTFKDVGEKALICEIALAEGAEVTQQELSSQFRCNGSDGYLAWLDQLLEIRETANLDLEGIDYDFRVFDSPVELHRQIVELNRINNRSRVVAGYCWDWRGKRDPEVRDVRIDAFGYARRWNLDKDGRLWIVTPGSEEDVGCIHTCQGLELDYVGVIIGPDLVVRDGRVVTDAGKRSRQDRSVSGYKSWLRRDPEAARAAADRVIKNTYRTLMTRGQKGCFVFSVDPETNAWLKARAPGRPDPAGSLLMAAEEPPPYETP
ncbi:DNA/RNA helicase domain-containing protein [Guyparkeria sp.]|uniref:DNA/RNA helicase domain-containing protein n=1 Tax=Guyparkeria sp. TaxID=2035736 RepID=UPI003562F89D